MPPEPGLGVSLLLKVQTPKHRENNRNLEQDACLVFKIDTILGMTKYLVIVNRMV